MSVFFNVLKSEHIGAPRRTTDNAGPNAVISVNKNTGGTATYQYDLNGNMTGGDGKILTYNAFNKPLTIRNNSIISTFSYGSSQMRYKQIKSGLPDGDETTLYIDKAYEEITQNGVTKKRSYLGDAILTETIGGADAGFKIGFVHRDRLNSTVTITDENGNVVDNKSFDPFGKPRKGTFERVDPNDPATLSVIREIEIAVGKNYQEYTNRGFTDHEHLDDAELIHMNGRVYDYNLGRFLSVDPFIQEPGNSQSMNPYSYIMNNPLAGTDPSGYKACAVSRIKSVCDGTPVNWGGNGSGNSTVVVIIDNGKNPNQGPDKPAPVEETNPSKKDEEQDKSQKVPSSKPKRIVKTGSTEEIKSTSGDNLGVSSRSINRELKQCAAVSAASSCSISNKKAKSLISNPAGADRSDKVNQNYVGKIIVDENGNIEINLNIAYAGNEKRARAAARNIRKAYGKAGITINFTVLENASNADLTIHGASLGVLVSSGLVCDCSTAQLIGGWAPSDSNALFPKSLLVTTVSAGNHYLTDAHEFGHKLGLAHRNDLGILSYPPERGRDRRKVIESDVKRIRSLYE